MQAGIEEEGKKEGIGSQHQLLPLEAIALSQKKKNALIRIPHSLLEGQTLAVPTGERQGARIFSNKFSGSCEIVSS